MKPQDIIFLVVLVLLLWKNNKNWTTLAGIFLLLLAIPLFAKYVFFTAEHIIYFAAAYFLLAIIQVLFGMIRKRS